MVKTGKAMGKKSGNVEIEEMTGRDGPMTRKTKRAGVLHRVTGVTEAGLWRCAAVAAVVAWSCSVV